MTTTTKLANTNDFTLGRGTHASVADGACLMEAVSYVAGEPWSDRPACVCPVLAAYGRSINDRMSDKDRQRLVPLIPRLVGTRGSPELTLRRMHLIVDRSVRQIVPLVLRDLGEPALALMLESIPPIVDRDSTRAAESLLGSAARDASDYAVAYASYASAVAYASYASCATSAASAASAYAASDFTADRAADRADRAATAYAASAATYAATAAYASSGASYTKKHAALVVAAFAEAIELQ